MNVRALRAGAWSLFALGVASGVAHDDAPPPHAVTMRAGYQVLAADFHVHTTLSDGGLSPLVVPWHARKRGLDVIAVTEHNGLLAAKIARFVARVLAPARAPLVMIGEEITTREAHLIAVGLEEGVAPTGDPADAIASVHAQGGVVFAAHPVERFWPKLLPVRATLDGSEVAHPFANPSARASQAARAAAGRPGGWRASDLEVFHAGAPNLAAIGSSDYHWGTGMGRVRTWIFVERDANGVTDRAVLDALRARRTVVRTADGELAGEPELVRALEADPLPDELDAPPAGTGTYEARSLADRVLRVAGLLGVLGLVLLRRSLRAS